MPRAKKLFGKCMLRGNQHTFLGNANVCRQSKDALNAKLASSPMSKVSTFSASFENLRQSGSGYALMECALFLMWLDRIVHANCAAELIEIVKSVFVGIHTMRIVTLSAVISCNNGSIGRTNILNSLGLNRGCHTIMAEGSRQQSAILCWRSSTMARKGG